MLTTSSFMEIGVSFCKAERTLIIGHSDKEEDFGWQATSPSSHKPFNNNIVFFIMTVSQYLFFRDMYTKIHFQFEKSLKINHFYPYL
ncbi:hypothetical protein M129_4560 [Bacteroides fragilis str. S6R5]|nr:hypothetical protein M129_4560 [Bacteroides fragilis str. S6R5]